MNDIPERIYISCLRSSWLPKAGGDWHREAKRESDTEYVLAWLPEWNIMPDVDGWYWFMGEYKVIGYTSVAIAIESPEFNTIWHDYRGLCKIQSRGNGNTASLIDDADEYDTDEMMGTWYGPIPVPVQLTTQETDND